MSSILQGNVTPTHMRLVESEAQDPQPDLQWMAPVDWDEFAFKEEVNNSTMETNPISSKSKVHSCAVCLKVFSSTLEFEKHRGVHNKQTVFDPLGHLISQNGDAFYRGSKDPKLSTGKKTRQNSYRGQMRHQCPDCQKFFSSPSKLRRHCLIHTGQRPFQCSVCGKSFRQLTHLNTHRETHRKPLVEQQKYPFKKMFEHSPDLTLHAGDHSSRDFQSRNHQSPQSDNLPDPNVESHSTLPSPELDLPFPQPLPNQHHEEISLTPDAIMEVKTEESSSTLAVNKNGFQCGICFKWFPLAYEFKVHYLIHTVARPYLCNSCGLAFGQESHLRKHKREHMCPNEFQDLSSSGDNGIYDHGDFEQMVTVSSVDARSLNAVQLEGNLTMKLELCDTDCNTSEKQMLPDKCVPPKQVLLKQPFDHERKTHQCPTCLRQFNAPSKLQRHILVHTGQRPYGCYLCGKRFRQLVHLKLHAITHQSSRHNWQKRRTFQTPEIINESSSPKVLSLESFPENHIPENHGLEHSVKENICQNVPFASTLENDVLQLERKKNHNKHQCLFCYKCFTSPSKLSRHALIHTGQKPYCCATCGKTFRQAAHVKVHQQIHSKSRPFSGVFQKKRLNLIRSASRGPALLRQRHLDSVFKDLPPQPDHTQEAQSGKNVLNADIPVGKPQRVTQRYSAFNGKPRSYGCSVCTKLFNAPSKLWRHNLIHTGQRPYKCLICLQAFRQSSHLKAHQSTHIRIKPKRIVDCQLKSNTSQSVFTGESEFTSAVQEVSTCETTILKFDSMTAAAKQVPSKVVITEERNRNGKSFVSLVTPHQHSLTHNKSLTCGLCGKKFRYAKHLQRHQMDYCVKAELRKCSEGTDMWLRREHQDQTASLVIVPLSENDPKVEEANLATNSPDDQGAPALGPYNSEEGRVVHGIDRGTSINIHKLDARSRWKRKEYECTECPKKFHSPSKLSRHFLIHSGVRPFPCSYCGKSFKQLSHLRKHQQIHQDSEGDCYESISLESKALKVSLNKLSREERIQTLDTHNKDPEVSEVCSSDIKMVSCKSHATQNVKSELSGFLSVDNNTDAHNQDEKRRNSIRVASPERIHPCSIISDLSCLPLEHYRSSKPKCECTIIKDEHVPNKVSEFVQTSEYEYPQNDLSSNVIGQLEVGTSCGSASRNSHICSECGKCFLSQSELENHSLIHTGKLPLQCNLCGSSFTQMAQLNLHLRIHTVNLLGPRGGSISDEIPSSPVSLGTSSGSFASIEEERNQMWQNLQESKLQDKGLDDLAPNTWCSKLPLSEGTVCFDHTAPLEAEEDLESQVYIQEPHDLARRLLPDYQHPKNDFGPERKVQQAATDHSRCFQKKYKCPQCEKSFSSPSKLERHHLIHAGQKPFQCPICGKSFRQAPHLKNHQRIHSSKVAGLSGMPQETKVQAGFGHDTNHLEPRAQYTYNSPSECGQDLSRDTSCGVGEDHFVIGTTVHPEKSSCSYQCTICFKNFNAPSKLKRHYVIHTGQRPFQCHTCGKSFTQSTHLKTHTVTHQNISPCARAVRLLL